MLNESTANSVQHRKGNSLNPCFNGICSMSGKEIKLKRTFAGLNPCFNGICSMRLLLSGLKDVKNVS